MMFFAKGWYLYRDDWDYIHIAKESTLEKAQIAAEQFWADKIKTNLYSLSVSDDNDTWRWKPGRGWEMQDRD